MMSTKRLKDESAKAYAAFKLYAEMGAQRSHAAVGQKLGKSKELLERWSSKFEWVKRAAQWDNEQAKLEENATEKAVETLALEQAKLRTRVQSKAAAWFDKLQGKAEQMLRFPLDRQTTTQTDANGNAVAVTIEPLNWRLSDLARLIELADQLGRLAAGMPSKITGVSDPEGKPFTLPVHLAGPPQPFTIHVERTDESEREIADIIKLRPSGA